MSGCLELETTPTVEIDVEQVEIITNLMEVCGYSREEALALLAEHSTDETQETKFSVDSLSSANWVVKKIAGCAADRQAINDMADDEISEIRNRQAKLLRKVEGRRAFFLAAYLKQLQDFTQAELTGKKDKSVGLIHGRMGFSERGGGAVTPKVSEEDAVATLSLACREDLIKVTKTVKTAEVKKALAEEDCHPEILKAFVISKPTRKFYIDVEGDKIEVVICPPSESETLEPAK